MAVRNEVWKLDKEISSLLATLREEEVVESLDKRKAISTSILQKEFDMGYSSASVLLDNLVKKGYVKQIKKSSSIKYEIVKKK